jgi:hypothetical protein
MRSRGEFNKRGRAVKQRMKKDKEKEERDEGKLNAED